MLWQNVSRRTLSYCFAMGASILFLHSSFLGRRWEGRSGVGTLGWYVRLRAQRCRRLQVFLVTLLYCFCKFCSLGCIRVSPHAIHWGCVISFWGYIMFISSFHLSPSLSRALALHFFALFSQTPSLVSLSLSLPLALSPSPSRSLSLSHPLSLSLSLSVVLSLSYSPSRSLKVA